jgi:hypothetical protein
MWNALVSLKGSLRNAGEWDYAKNVGQKNLYNFAGFDGLDALCNWHAGSACVILKREFRE